MSSYQTTALGKTSKDGNFEKITIGRVRTSDFDVDIDIKYCGLCHTDLHLVIFYLNTCTATKW
jgi:D-arabinose 1-dehydrogenase-like Zn-dependent alcohol dehydrogenase